MKIIGVTGNSGSGKSVISKMLKEKYNAYLIDSDEIARDLSNNNTKYMNEIVKEFGTGILKQNKLNRRKLAETIYSNPENRKKLNLVTFKYIKHEIMKKIEREKATSNYIILDAPLLFESGLDGICDYIVGVIADKNVKIDRIMKRDKIDREIAEKRIDSQLKDQNIIENSNYTISNNFKNSDELKKIVERIVL